DAALSGRLGRLTLFGSAAESAIAGFALRFLFRFFVFLPLEILDCFLGLLLASFFVVHRKFPPRADLSRSSGACHFQVCSGLSGGSLTGGCRSGGRLRGSTGSGGSLIGTSRPGGEMGGLFGGFGLMTRGTSSR